MREIVRERVHAIPALEWERLRRVSRELGHQVDSSHPPTALGRDLVASREPESAGVHLSAADEVRIDRELAPYVPSLQERLYEQHTFAW